MSGRLYLLGPQRPTPNMPRVLATIPGSGRVLYVTAGWRLDENDDEALKRDVGVSGFSLPLYEWFEELAKTAPELFTAHHEQQEEIRRLKALYRLRLDSGVEAARLLIAEREQAPDNQFVRGELEDAFAMLFGLRRRLIAQCDQIRLKFMLEHRPHEHPAVIRRTAEMEELLAETRAVLVAGGHVGVLRNRLEFFGMSRLLRDAMRRGTHVIAWSAGAMSLTDQVVLFHDDPPTGQHHSEILDRGLGLAPDIVALPHARQRLFLDDRAKVMLMARRFDPVPCIGLENGAWIERVRGVWINYGHPESAFRLGKDGRVHALERAEPGEGAHA